jgi:hypothetical protein
MNESRLLALLLVVLVALFAVSLVLTRVRYLSDVTRTPTTTAEVTTTAALPTVAPNVAFDNSALTKLSRHEVSALARERRLHPFEPLDVRPTLGDDELTRDTRAYVAPENGTCGAYASDSRFLWYRRETCYGQGHAHMDFSCMLTEAATVGRISVIPDALCVAAAHSDHLVQQTAVEWHHMYNFNALIASGARVVLESHFLALLASGCFARDNITLSGNEGGPARVLESGAPLVIRDYRPLAGPRVRHHATFELCNLYHKELDERVAPLPSKRVTYVAQTIARALGTRYFSLHVRRSDKVLDIWHWPTLDEETQPKAILGKLSAQIPARSVLFLITDQPEPRQFFELLEERWTMRYWSDFQSIFDEFNLTTYLRYAAEQLVCMWNPSRTDSDHKFHFETFPDLTDLPRDGLHS